MLLRSITNHIKEQNWLAVLIDFMIVVVGVFIGIQVANWNESLAENELSNRYMEQLTRDIRADIIDINTSYKTSQWRLAALSVLLEKSDIALVNTFYNPEREVSFPAVSIEEDSIQYLINASTYTRFLDDDRPAYISLVNSGNARLIGKLKPWPCIQSYYAQYKEVRLFEERLLLFRTELIRTQHDAGISIAGHLSEEETLERIRTNQTLSAAMSSYRLFSFYYMTVLDELRQRAILLLELLETNSAQCDFNTGEL
ncbi:DUF6090 family protein [Aliiglaciecola litoralis]|uniref:Uncharacterized protein n=1 Tax=Aliiglaciecola litoralis TaxID=582857 RepID=A0ABN1LC57_9ALTE